MPRYLLNIFGELIAVLGRNGLSLDAVEISGDAAEEKLRSMSGARLPLVRNGEHFPTSISAVPVRLRGSKLTADPLPVITAIRESHPDMAELYTNGQCYAFHLILKTMWPEARCLYDGHHIYTEINGRVYDIEGEHESPPLNARPIDPDRYSSDHPENWGKRDTRRLIDCGRILQRAS